MSKSKSKFEKKYRAEVRRMEKEYAPIKKALSTVKNPNDKEEVFGVVFKAIFEELKKGMK